VQILVSVSVWIWNTRSLWSFANTLAVN